MADKMRHIFTSESVTEGHPDKMADQISDAVLDAILKDDPTARVACETLVTTGLCVVSGEITTTTHIEVPDLVRQVVADIVYHPRRTALLEAAAAVGARTVDGLGMLVHQAALQQRLWHGHQADIAVMTAAAEAELAARGQ